MASLTQNETNDLQKKIVYLEELVEKIEQTHKKEMCAKKAIEAQLKVKNKSRNTEIKKWKSEIEALTKYIQGKFNGKYALLKKRI